ncbi:MAG TPA: hypothetical protein DCS63_05095 [Elusimicrobia bacterium]|nr:hypothetical protein [Elusimicrobiota bacterium]
MLLWIIVYCTVFALAWAWALVWVIEREDKTFMHGTISFADAFLVGAFSLIFVYISNIIVIIRWPRSAFLYDLLLVTGLAGFGLYKETVYKTRAVLSWKRLRDEALALEWNITKDPANGAYYERLSEVYEKMGKTRRALEAAREAEKLGPSVKNALRIKYLERDRLSGRQRRG